MTSNSDDNLLKNIELFDKLVLRFNGRVLFVKDVLGDEICCWSFYGEGRKIAEVCCTSIVYATEKKQTKVSMIQWLLADNLKAVISHSGKYGSWLSDSELDSSQLAWLHTEMENSEPGSVHRKHNQHLNQHL